MPFIIEITEQQIKSEKEKARELRKTRWWQNILARGVCHWCGGVFTKDDITMDHVVPVSRGGKSCRGNLVPACKQCNTHKKYLLPMEWDEYLENTKVSGELRAKAFKAVIYDCDGVMFDSFDANLRFYQRIMRVMGRPLLDRGDAEHMRVLHTYANREVLAYFFPDSHEFQQAVSAAASIDYLELVPYMIIEEGFRDTLDALNGRVELAVCTNRSTSMDTVLESFGLTGYFGCVMTASKVLNPKPHPEPLLKVLDYYGLEPGEAVFVGDSEVDRLSAEAAGVPFVAYKADLQGLARIDRHQDILTLF